MNEKDLLEAIGEAKEEMLEQSEKKPGKISKLFRLRNLVAAACAVLLIIGVAQRSPEHKICPEPISWDTKLYVDGGGKEDSMSSISIYHGPSYCFVNGIAVEAKVLEVLPDLYSFMAASYGTQPYRVLRMKTLDVLHGEGMPSEFYYCIPARLSTDLEQYSSLILMLEQRGIENFLMRNMSQNRLETLDMVFTSGYDYDPNWGAVLAFYNGVVDESLWDLEGWNTAKETMQYRLTKDTVYPGAPGRTVREVKRMIAEQLEIVKQANEIDIERMKVYRLADFASLGTIKAINYVKPFDNGVFWQETSMMRYTQSIGYYRVIDGFKTNEYIYITSDDGKLSARMPTVKFTDEDIRNLPDLGKVIEDLSKQNGPAGFRDAVLINAEGWYFKKDNEVCGAVIARWGYAVAEEEQKGPTCLLVDRIARTTYYKVTKSGEMEEITSSEYNNLFR